MPLAFKGLVACLLLLLYAGLMAVYILAHRHELAEQRRDLEQMQRQEEALKRAGLGVSNTVLAARQHSMGEDPASLARETAPYALEATTRALDAWRTQLPGLLTRIDAARLHLATLAEVPSRGSLLALREMLDQIANEIEFEGAKVGERRSALGRRIREHGDEIALHALALGVGGLLIFGGITAWFFARLAADLRQLGDRANQIVGGYRGEPLDIGRRDEVGQLARDVNQMASTLSAREHDLTLARERQAHREKMASLGAIARALSHEIGNPLATISGIVQEADIRRDAPVREALNVAELLHQTRRIADITRQIAEFAGPRADAPSIVDTREAVATVCEFMRFDPRLRGTRLVAHLPAHLPPLLVVPDQLSEVLMGLLQPDAGDGTAASGPQELCVEVAARGDDVEIRSSGSALGKSSARRERIRQLVLGMGGRLVEDGSEVKVILPAALSLIS